MGGHSSKEEGRKRAYISKQVSEGKQQEERKKGYILVNRF